MSESEMNTSGCADNIKNSKYGMVFHCCGADAEDRAMIPLETTRMAAEAFFCAEHLDAKHVVSHFYSTIANAFFRADSTNLQILTDAFPEMAVAFAAWQEDSDALYARHRLV